MNLKTEKKLNLWAGVLLVIINVVLLNLLLDRVRVFRLDLTEGNLYTLSEPTIKILEELEEPVRIIFYYSSREAQHALIRPLIAPMKDILSEFQAEGGSKVQLEFVEIDTAGTKAQEEAANQYGVRPFTVPVKTVYESGVKSTWFSIVVETNGAYEEININSSFTELFRWVEQGSGSQDGRLELADIEYAVTKTIHQLTRQFTSVPGALVAHDQRAEVRVLLSDAARLPEDLKDLAETIKKVTDTMIRQSEGRITVTFEDPIKNAKSLNEVNAIAQPLYDKYRVRPFVTPRPDGGEDYGYSAMIVTVGSAFEHVSFERLGAVGESDFRQILESVIKPLIPGLLPTVGLSIPAPPAPPMNPFGQRPQQPRSEFEYTQRQLERDFQVERVDLAGDKPEISRKVEVLVLVRPETLSDAALFAVDQFVMRGGRLVVLADSHFLDQQKMRMDPFATKKSVNPKLQNLLAHWGFKVDSGVLQDTRSAAVSVPQQRVIGGQMYMEYVPVKYPYALVLRDERLTRDHPITSSIEMASFLWASSVSIENPPPGATSKVLATTSSEGSSRMTVESTKTALNTEYSPPDDASERPIMATVTARFPSYFADKPIPGVDAPAEKGDEKKEEKEKDADPAQDSQLFKGAPLKVSEKTTITVCGDADFISPLSVEMLGLGSSAFIDHLRLLKNAVDWGGPNSTILTIRNRASTVRPLGELVGKTPEERKDEGESTALLTFGISWGVILVMGAVWLAVRASRRPLPLPSVQPTSTGEAA